MILVGAEHKNIDVINNYGLNCLISTIIKLETGNIEVTVTMKPYNAFLPNEKNKVPKVATKTTVL